MGQILRVLDQSRWRRKLDKGKLINVDNPMTYNPTSTLGEDANQHCWAGSPKLVGNSAAVVEEGMPEMREQTRKYRFQSVQKSGLEWLYYFQPENLPTNNVLWQSLEDTLFNKQGKHWDEGYQCHEESQRCCLV